MSRQKLVLVHGRGQQGRDATHLRALWIAALRKGLGREREAILDELEIVFPFYGDILDRHARGLEKRTSKAFVDRPEEIDPELLAFQAALLDEARRSAGVTHEQVADRMERAALVRGPFAWEWVQALLRVLDDIPGVDRRALELFTYDAYIYLHRPAARAAVNACIAEHVQDEGAVVVAHSLGSVAAYDVLRTRAPAADIRLYFTIGSPLGSPAFRKALVPISYPAGVGGWHNAFDDRDVVALYPLAAPHFTVTPPVENDATIRNGTPNNHGIEGYLRNASVAIRIYQALV